MKLMKYMKIKIKKQNNGEWLTQLNKGNGGLNSLVSMRQCKSFFRSISILFSFKKILKAI